jgi:type I restriction enzyme S subunit
MSKLDELIAELCPDGVEYIPLGEVLKNNNAPNSISKKYYKDNGDIPIIDQSQVYIAGYTDDESAVPPILPCIIFGDHTRVVKYADRKFAQGDSGTKVFIPVTEDLNTKYIYYAFCNIDIPSRGYNRHWTIAKNIKIPLPPLPVQQEIVRILDNFTELTAELTAELTTRRKQYEYYRDLLLTFGDEVEWKPLEESIVSLTTGLNPRRFFRLNTDDALNYYVTIREIQNNTIVFSDKTDRINDEALKLCNNRSNLEVGDVLFSGTGTIGETAVVSEPPYKLEH